MMMSGLKSRISCALAFRLAAGHRDHRRAEPLCAVVRAEAAGEQAVTVGDVHLVFGGGAAGAQTAGDDIGPVIDVALGVTHHRRAAGGA